MMTIVIVLTLMKIMVFRNISTNDFKKHNRRRHLQCHHHHHHNNHHHHHHKEHCSGAGGALPNIGTKSDVCRLHSYSSTNHLSKAMIMIMMTTAMAIMMIIHKPLEHDLDEDDDDKPLD